MNTPNINPSITQTHPHRNLPLIQRQENADPEKYTMCIQNPFLDLVHERFNLNTAGVPQRVGDNPLYNGSVGLIKNNLKFFSYTD